MTLTRELQRSIVKEFSDERAAERSARGINEDFAHIFATRLAGLRLEGMPEPTEAPRDMLATVQALKEAVETMSKLRGRPEDSVVTVQDLTTVLEIFVPFIVRVVRDDIIKNP